jgi:cyclohexanecarboxyl-CoA dehydrogenase
MNIGYVTINISLVGQILAAHGSPDIVDPWITGMLRGDVLPSIALTEPGGGSDAASLALAARRDGDGYVLTGEKTSIRFAAQAGFSVVFARTGTPEPRARGISAFPVPLDSPGLTSSAFDDHGGRSVARTSLDETWAHARQRTSMGAALWEHRGVSFPLAEAETQVTAARLLCLLVIARQKAGRPAAPRPADGGSA